MLDIQWLPARFIHRPSRVCILKTEQDRPTFTTEYYIEVGSCDSVAAFRSSPDASLQWGRLSPSQESMVVFHLFIAVLHLYPCGETETMSHIVESCPLIKLNGGLSLLHSADEDAVSCLLWVMTQDTHEKKKIAMLECRWVTSDFGGQGIKSQSHTRPKT